MTSRDAGPRVHARRRCAACGHDTLEVVHAWQHRRAGIDTHTETLELECSRCRAKVVLHPWTTILAEKILAFLLMPAVIPGVYFLVRARRQARAWSDNPVVGDTGVLARPRPAPPTRLCTCGRAADCVAIVRQGTWSLSLGRRHDYRCPHCQRRFVVHDAASVVVMGSIAAVLGGVGALVVLHPPGTAVGAAASNQLFGVGLIVLGLVAAWVLVARVRGRRLHPKAPGALSP